MKNRLLRFFTLIATSTLLWSCATNSARSLIEATKSSDPVIPDEGVIAQEFENRAFKLGTVHFSPHVVLKNLADIPDEAYPILLQGQLQKAFDSARVTQGVLPPCSVDIFIDQLEGHEGYIHNP